MKISEIMNSYTDTEFLIDGDCGADTQAVLQGVTAKVEKPKKRLSLGKSIMIAAAAVVGVSLVTAASAPVATFTSLTGQVVEYSILDNFIQSHTGMGEFEGGTLPYSVEGDRIYFTADGGHTDITDLISEEDVYFYEYTKEDNRGNEHHGFIAVAGTVRDPGYGEVITGLTWWHTTAFCSSVNVKNYLVDGNVVNINDMTEEQYQNLERYTYLDTTEDRPWVAEFNRKYNEYFNSVAPEGVVEMDIGEIAE